MDMEPDEDRDVILHPIILVDATTGTKRPTWNVYLGQELRAEYDRDIAGVNAALDLAAAVERPAWIYDREYPLKALTEDDRQVDYVATCPKAHLPVHVRKAGELHAELKAGTLRHYCMICDLSWPATPEEQMNLQSRMQREEAERSSRRK